MADDIIIKRVGSQRDLRRFCRFKNRLYRNSRYAVPELFTNLMGTLSREKNSAFEFCESEYFLAYRGKKLAGRVAAIINRKANEKWNRRIVRFGWIDFIDDRKVSAALLQAVEQWGKSKGMTEIQGPLGFTNFDAEGMLVEGFDRLGTMASIYNHPYYPEHLEKLGFTKEADWVEFFIEIPDDIPEKHRRIGELVKSRYGLEVRKFDSVKEIAERYGQTIFRLMNEAYSPLYGFSPLSDRQIEEKIRTFIPLLNPRLITLVTDREDNVVAAGISMPSLSHTLQKAKGRLFPFGWYHLMRYLYMKKYSDILDLLLVAVKPEYQNKGVNALLFNELIPVYRSMGFKHAESNPELELNSRVQAQWSYFHSECHKRRRSYVKPIG